MLSRDMRVCIRRKFDTILNITDRYNGVNVPCRYVDRLFTPQHIWFCVYM